MSLRFLYLLPALALVSCETTPVVYQSEPIDPPKALAMERNTAPKRIDVYRSQSEIRGLHRVIGEVRLSTDGRQSAPAIRSSFEIEARSRNAQGVVVQDPADRLYGVNGPGFNQPREIVAIFIRYDKDRSSGYGRAVSSPYSSQSEPFSSYQQQGVYSVSPDER